jgi:2-polyprenyl-6-methoxyphenol hydroxylase-like FAD-dependent oxidoreductase
MRIITRTETALSLPVLLLLVSQSGLAAALSSVTNSITTTPLEPRNVFTAPSKNKQCVVVGGGPVGLATALTLARPPHSYAVTVLEQSAGEASVKNYDPTRSYLYNVNPRGLGWFAEQAAPASAMVKLAASGSAPADGVSAFVVVPADPTILIPPPKPVSISGQIKLSNRTQTYWIPRHLMVQLLLECCQEQNALAENPTAMGSIAVHAGKQVDLVSPVDGDSLVVHCRDGSTYTGSLVVAADGIDSAIRSCLAMAEPSRTTQTWLQSQAKRFQIKRYRSPSTGLKL